MAPSYPDAQTRPHTPARRGPCRLRLLLALAAALAAGMPAAAPAQSALQPDAPIELDADRSDYDRRRDEVVFERVTITQADMRIEAEQGRASRLDFDDAVWEFSGDVQVTLGEARLEADEAQLQFRGHQLIRAVAQGAPTRFEDRGSLTGQQLRGTAEELEYDLEEAIVRLAGQAWLSEGANEISGASLVYDLGEERVIAEGDLDERVHITITPPGSDFDAGDLLDSDDEDDEDEDGADDPEDADDGPDEQEPDRDEHGE